LPTASCLLAVCLTCQETRMSQISQDISQKQADAESPLGSWYPLAGASVPPLTDGRKNAENGAVRDCPASTGGTEGRYCECLDPWSYEEYGLDFLDSLMHSRTRDGLLVVSKPPAGRIGRFRSWIWVRAAGAWRRHMRYSPGKRRDRTPN